MRRSWQAYHGFDRRVVYSPRQRYHHLNGGLNKSNSVGDRTRTCVFLSEIGLKETYASLITLKAGEIEVNPGALLFCLQQQPVEKGILIPTVINMRQPLSRKISYTDIPVLKQTLDMQCISRIRCPTSNRDHSRRNDILRNVWSLP